MGRKNRREEGLPREVADFRPGINELPGPAGRCRRGVVGVPDDIDDVGAGGAFQILHGFGEGAVDFAAAVDDAGANFIAQSDWYALISVTQPARLLREISSSTKSI